MTLKDHPAQGQMRSHTARAIIGNNPESTRKVPEPPDTLHGIAHSDQTGLRRLARVGVIERVGYCDGDHPQCPHDDCERCDVRIWRATPRGYEVIQEVLAHRTLLDCGHPPFCNPRGVDGYSCTDEDCDATYSRDEIEEVTG